MRLSELTMDHAEGKTSLTSKETLLPQDIMGTGTGTGTSTTNSVEQRRLSVLEQSSKGAVNDYSHNSF